MNRGLSETLARRRRLYERLLLSRMGGRLSPEDAEDIVSESLTRLESGLSKHPPASGKELGWFARVVLNQGIDFLCARDGRPRNGAAPRPVPVPITGVGDQEIASLSTDEEATTIADLGSVAETREAQELVQRVLANLPPEDVRLITLRHVHAADARRDEVAALAGLTVSEFRWRYGRVVEGHLDHNPARPVRKPRQRRERKADPIPPEVIEIIRADFLERGDRASALLVCLMAYGGLRTLNEISELELRDIGTRVMRVNARKTHRLRTVDLLDPLAADLRSWQQALDEMSPQTPVVPRSDGEHLVETDWRNWRRRIYRPAARRAGLEKSRPYDLRHSFVSLLIWEGRSVAEVAEQAGHSVETCSRDYVHVFKNYDPARRITAAARIEAARAAAEGRR